MSLLIASVFASATVSGIKNKRATEAQAEADEIAKYSDLIDIEVQAQSNEITKYNDARSLNALESSQLANTASQGKRGSSASLQNMQSIAREDQQLNFDRMDESLALSKEMGKLNDSARKSASDQASKSRNLDTASKAVNTGLLFAGKK